MTPPPPPSRFFHILPEPTSFQAHVGFALPGAVWGKGDAVLLHTAKCQHLHRLNKLERPAHLRNCFWDWYNWTSQIGGTAGHGCLLQQESSPYRAAGLQFCVLLLLHAWKLSHVTSACGQPAQGCLPKGSENGGGKQGVVCHSVPKCSEKDNQGARAWPEGDGCLLSSPMS